MSKTLKFYEHLLGSLLLFLIYCTYFCERPENWFNVLIYRQSTVEGAVHIHTHGETLHQVFNLGSGFSYDPIRSKTNEIRISETNRKFEKS